MSDIITLLPDSIANQIAAGEVVQRPASVVKELMENAVDAGATNIKLIVRDAGRTLIQVIDNGSGMSDTDARMAFERHATSKIKSADDLFSIKTMGFRGEALASIASIAYVELKTRRKEDELGTGIVIENSEIKENERITCSEGSSFAVKNLFYNVPARRNFLKSNQIELKHIMDEFERVALSYPEIGFSMYSNDNEIYRVDKSNLKQRLIGIFGNNYNQRLLSVEQKTGIADIFGYVCKPEYSKKVRGEQFFFVNRRFIKSNYLNNAVQRAYEELVTDKSYPSYFINILVDPHTIDVNIHPTKTEIKFEEERNIYALLHSAVKESIGKFGIVPSLNFDSEVNLNIPIPKREEGIKVPTVNFNPSYNPFKNESGYKRENVLEKINRMNWEKMYDGINDNKSSVIQNTESPISLPGIIPVKEEERNGNEPVLYSDTEELNGGKIYQLRNRYIMKEVKEGLMLIDQERAHERILYEKFQESLLTGSGFSQQVLFPNIIEFNKIDFELLKELKEDLLYIGIDISEESENKFSVNGIPPELKDRNIKGILEEFLEKYKNEDGDVMTDKRDKLAKSMARSMSIKSPRTLTENEMNDIIEELFTCKIINKSPYGKTIFCLITNNELELKFN